MERSVIFDFDGTVCIGDEPALAYARAVAEAEPRLGDLPTRVAAYLRGEDSSIDADDGYQAVQLAATAAGVPLEVIQTAFLAARAGISDGSIDVRAPEGLSELLTLLRDGGVRAVLVTNAPPGGLDRILARLDLSDAFDSIYADAGKPHGMEAILDDAVGAGRIEWSNLLSIGDIWENDLRIPHERGAATALIDPLNRRRGQPDVRTETLGGLTPWVKEWMKSRGNRPVTGS